MIRVRSRAICMWLLDELMEGDLFDEKRSLFVY